MPARRAVSCFFNGVKQIPIDREELNRWVVLIAEHYQVTVKKLQLIFCSDEELLLLNKEYLDHDTLTDIITFPYHEPGNPIEGELYISLDRVNENAADMGLEPREELDRVIAHGLLHMIGYQDHTKAQKEVMRRQENYCLTLRG